MAGSLRLVKAPDVYELRVYVGRDRSGRVKHRYERFIGNKRSAQRALAALVTEVEQAKENDGRSRQHLGIEHHLERRLRRMEAERLAGPLAVHDAPLREHLACSRRALDRASQDLRAERL